jgi:hypothetical protein
VSPGLFLPFYQKQVAREKEIEMKVGETLINLRDDEGFGTSQHLTICGPHIGIEKENGSVDFLDEETSSKVWKLMKELDQRLNEIIRNGRIETDTF